MVFTEYISFNNCYKLLVIQIKNIMNDNEG